MKCNTHVLCANIIHLHKHLSEASMYRPLLPDTHPVHLLSSVVKSHAIKKTSSIVSCTKLIN